MAQGPSVRGWRLKAANYVRQMSFASYPKRSSILQLPEGLCPIAKSY
jgi:hypothetical protein